MLDLVGIGLLLFASLLFARTKWGYAGLLSAVAAQSVGLALVPLGAAAVGLSARVTLTLRAELRMEGRPMTRLEWGVLLTYGLSLL